VFQLSQEGSLCPWMQWAPQGTNYRIFLYFLYIFSSVFMADSYPLWIVDLGEIDHVVKDHDLFVNFHWIPRGLKWLYVGNNSHVPVKGICTCKLDMRDGRTSSYMIFSLHLNSTKSYICCYFLRFRFTLNICSTNIKLYLDDVCYR
jgi:hypothetical protein